MDLEGRNLSLNTRSPDVDLLLQELRALHFDIAGDETGFGQATAGVVNRRFHEFGDSGVVTGVVASESGEPTAGARVEAPGLGLSAPADEAGRYEIGLSRSGPGPAARLGGGARAAIGGGRGEGWERGVPGERHPRTQTAHLGTPQGVRAHPWQSWPRSPAVRPAPRSPRVLPPAVGDELAARRGDALLRRKARSNLLGLPDPTQSTQSGQEG